MIKVGELVRKVPGGEHGHDDIFGFFMCRRGSLDDIVMRNGSATGEFFESSDGWIEARLVRESLYSFDQSSFGRRGAGWGDDHADECLDELSFVENDGGTLIAVLLKGVAEE